MSHINDFFEDDDSSGGCFRLWKNVTDGIKGIVSVEEQRIVISSLMYIIYDIMTAKVKEYKEDPANDHDLDSTAAPSSAQDDVFFESNVSLYRYGGFALHSLLQKYKHEKGPKGNIIPLLKQLVIRPDQMTMIPEQIHDLNQGGLVIMNPCMLPYLRVLIEKVYLPLSMINAATSLARV